MDDARFDRWTRSLAHATPRRSFVGGSIGLAVATFASAPAAMGDHKKKRCDDPEEDYPFDGLWKTEVDDRSTDENDHTRGRLFVRTLVDHRGDVTAIVGDYSNTVGNGHLEDCNASRKSLECRWIQTSDGTSGTFSLKLEDETSFKGTYTKDEGGGGKYKGWFKRNLHCELNLKPGQDPHTA